MRWIPQTGSVKWWAFAGGSTIVAGAAICLIRFGLAGQTFTAGNAFRMVLLAAILSIAFSFAGWLGARFLWGLSNIGLLAGLVAMAVYGTEQNGWEDLASVVSFLMLTGAGIASGVLAEIVAAVVRYWKKKQR